MQRAAFAGKQAQAADAAISGALRDRLVRIAWLSAHAYGVHLDDVLTRPRFKPKATFFPRAASRGLVGLHATRAGNLCSAGPSQARMVAMALARDVLSVPLERLGEFFDDDKETIAASCNRVAEREEANGDFRTTMKFLRSSCAAALGLSG